MSRTIVLIPDAHIPDHHVRAVNNLVNFVSAYQPDSLYQTGDLMDMKGPARWSKGSAVEYEDDLQAGADATVKVLGMFREVYEGPFYAKQGNHDIRAERYLQQYAPALRSLRALRFADLLELDSLGVELLDRTPTGIAPGWVVTHGDEGRLARYAGGTAIALARAYGVSVVCGHTHRQGIINETQGLAARVLTGFELGHVMNPAKADYLKLPPNWQLGFGILHVTSSGRVSAQAVPMTKSGGFTVEGVTYP